MTDAKKTPDRSFQPALTEEIRADSEQENLCTVFYRGDDRAPFLRFSTRYGVHDVPINLARIDLLTEALQRLRPMCAQLDMFRLADNTSKLRKKIEKTRRDLKKAEEDLAKAEQARAGVMNGDSGLFIPYQGD